MHPLALATIDDLLARHPGTGAVFDRFGLDTCCGGALTLEESARAAGVPLPALADEAVAAHPTRPATTLAHDTPDARLVVFRIRPGQQVPPHTSGSTVILSVVAGEGVVSGGDGETAVSAGDVVTFAPNEPHGMRATGRELVLLATIAPRPAAR